jgi:short-subunit dehydrogenase
MKSAWLILGASSAIARAFARRTAASGATVMLVARDGEDANALAADLVLRGSPSCRAIGFDGDIAAQLSQLIPYGLPLTTLGAFNAGNLFLFTARTLHP